jgi:hypothetical protein
VTVHDGHLRVVAEADEQGKLGGADIIMRVPRIHQTAIRAHNRCQKDSG